MYSCKSNRETNDKKILSYKSKKENVIVIVSLIISIVVTNSFIIFSASIIWTFDLQQSAGLLTGDVIYYIGYASFGNFLYSLYYHFFRKEFEPFILILIAIIILIVLIFIVDSIVSTLRLLSTQPVDISVVIAAYAAYPILDAILIFPIVIMPWAVRRISNRHKNATLEEEQKIGQKIKEKDKSSPFLLALVELSCGYYYCL
jgi:hypothetical protein